jgi:hypothetical protein
MVAFEAGFSSIEITPDNMGFPLYGYSGRKENSQGVHDPLLAKTMVLKAGQAAWSLTVLDLVGINAATVTEIRQIVAKNTGLQTQAVMVACIHTHSGPNVGDPGNWNHPVAEIIAEGIIAAWGKLQPAKIGTSAGFLYGYHVNRRWMERPVDPSVNVVRFDDLAGNPLGVAANFGLHPVVMGYDNYQISADYVGVARRVVEQTMGCTCLFANGAAADVNPITQNVRKQLAEHRSFVTMTGAYYFGRGNPRSTGGKDTIVLADRIGGTFAEVEEIGQAVGSQIVYVANAIQTQDPPSAPWSFDVFVNHLDEGEETIETFALGIGDFILVGEPGEMYVETGLDLKAKVRKYGYRFPWVVSYANDYQAYLSPEAAFAEGGYEVEMSKMAKHSPHIQSRFWEALSQGIPPAVAMEIIQYDGQSGDGDAPDDTQAIKGE